MKKHKNVIQKTAEAPAEVLARTVVATQRVGAALPGSAMLKKTKDYWHMLGPGLTTGASDDDPSGIATYSQAGAEFGYSMLWTMLLSYPLMAAIQEISARIGRVTGRGLAGNIRVYCPRWLADSMAAAVFLANVINI